MNALAELRRRREALASLGADDSVAVVIITDRRKGLHRGR
jgi:hypothetical protein